MDSGAAAIGGATYVQERKANVWDNLWFMLPWAWFVLTKVKTAMDVSTFTNTTSVSRYS